MPLIKEMQYLQHVAKLHLAANTLASLYYARLYTVGLVVVTVLTVVVGSKGVASLVSEPVNAVNIVLSCCDVLLGVAAALLTNLELKGKSERYHRRACAYTLLSSKLEIDMCISRAAPSAHEQERLMAMLRTMPDRLSELEQQAEALPLRYRLQAQTMPHDLFYADDSNVVEAAAAAAAVATTARYAEAHEREGSRSWSRAPAAATLTASDLIMSQAL